MTHFSISYQKSVTSILQRFHASGLASDLINILLPAVCAGCKQVGSLLCADCLATVTWMDEPLCMSCGRPTNHSVLRCHACLQQSPPWQQVRAAALFAPPISQTIYLMKYQGYLALAQPLADLMVTVWPRWQIPVDLVLPIPLHARRKRERGFNQSELLVQQLCQQLGWQTETQALWRVRHTRPQVGLAADDRLTNLSGAFEANPDYVAGKRILLVDDVCTTGATLAAAAHILLETGAESVSGYCIARATGNQDNTFL